MIHKLTKKYKYLNPTFLKCKPECFIACSKSLNVRYNLTSLITAFVYLNTHGLEFKYIDDGSLYSAYFLPSPKNIEHPHTSFKFQIILFGHRSTR